MGKGLLSTHGLISVFGSPNRIAARHAVLAHDFLPVLCASAAMSEEESVEIDDDPWHKGYGKDICD